MERRIPEFQLVCYLLRVYPDRHRLCRKSFQFLHCS